MSSCVNGTLVELLISMLYTHKSFTNFPMQLIVLFHQKQHNSDKVQHNENGHEKDAQNDTFSLTYTAESELQGCHTIQPTMRP